MSLNKIEKRGQEVGHLSQSDADLFIDVTEENIRKNSVVPIIEQFLTDFKTKNYKFDYQDISVPRILDVQVVDMVVDPAKKTNIQSAFDSTFGSKRVRLV